MTYLSFLAACRNDEGEPNTGGRRFFCDHDLSNSKLNYQAMESEKHASDDAHIESGSFSSQPVDPEEERLLVRKLDRRILPITCLLYLFSCTS